MSSDWAAKAEPVPYSKLDDPQTLNSYAYLRNNPMNAVDPDEHMPVSTNFNPTMASDYNDDSVQDAQADISNLETMASEAENSSAAEQHIQTNNANPSQLPKEYANQSPQQPAPQQPGSWDPGKPLPPDPSGLGPEWVKDTGHRDPNAEAYDNPKTGGDGSNGIGHSQVSRGSEERHTGITLPPGESVAPAMKSLDS